MSSKSYAKLPKISFIALTQKQTFTGLLFRFPSLPPRKAILPIFIDSLAAAGAVLADVWVGAVSMPVIDSLGDEFLQYVKDGMTVTVKADGIVEVNE